MDDSAIIFDEVIDADAQAEAMLNDEATCKMQNLYTLLAFLFITLALLIAVSISGYLIKY